MIGLYEGYMPLSGMRLWQEARGYIVGTWFTVDLATLAQMG
jgi:hypothetical protein